jgi:hypothetical protein
MYVSLPGVHSWTESRLALTKPSLRPNPFLGVEIVTFDVLGGIILSIDSFIDLARRKKENS